MYQVNIGSKKIEVEPSQEAIYVNQTLFDGDIQALSEGKFHVVYKNKSIEVELVEVNYSEKTFVFKINGKSVALSVKDRFDLLLDKMGMSNANQVKINQVKAPMPGLILEIKASVGQSVEKGNPLLILEAMKMENVIKSPTDGIIKTIKVEKGNSVEKNEVLIVFE